MQQQNTRRSVSCRFRNLPRPVGLVLLALPVAASVGAFGLPALAASSPAPQTSSSTALVSAVRPAAAPVTATAHATSATRPATAAHSTPATAAKSGHGTPKNAGKKSAADPSKELAAFFKAGYSYDDAVLLSRLWAQASAYDAKVWAGGKLLNHVPLPVKPGATAWTVSDDVALQAYFNNGYDYADAQKLAKVWKTATPSDAKVKAGHKVLAGLELPQVAKPVPQSSDQQQVDAFFKAGYSYDDAVLLSRLWAKASAYDAKVWAGGKLLNHVPLPVKPGATAWTVSDDVALQAYFNNGYDYADAQKLAKVWKTATPSDAKVKAGHKVLAGITLPLK